MTKEGPYLLGKSSTLSGQCFPLKGSRMVIGRDPAQCQIVVDNPAVGRRHAAVEIDASGQAKIIDLNSRNGTFVNGEPISERVLHPDDLIALGDAVSFLFRSPGKNPPETHPAQPSSVVVSGAVPMAGTMVYRAVQKHVLRIGRAPDNDILLIGPSVSRYHATLTYSGQRLPRLEDVGSTNGTYVNGHRLEHPRPVSPKDLIYIGNFLLSLDGFHITQRNLNESRIIASRISKAINGKLILDDVSLAIYPGEFVGLMGPSGCGKSTLLDALSGLRPATAGQVLVNDLELYRNFDALRRSIGYVPQRDVLHEPLSVWQTLHYAAQLRLPPARNKAEIEQTIDEVIRVVGLDDQRDNPFRRLSGGQQKRLSLGMELITKPSFLFLDEPTSPLDPLTSEDMMLLFRHLANEGRVVIVVTHKFEKFEEMHHVAILAEGGKLAFFGPPLEALEYFGCDQPSDIYRRIGTGKPDDVKRGFQRSSQYEQYVASRITESTMDRPAWVTSTQAARSPERKPGLKQWLTLTRRYLETKLTDMRNTLILLAQAPIIAIILAAITGDTPNDTKTLFIAAIIAIWIGANNAIREIVSEVPIYQRERLSILKIPSYVLSKFVVLGGIGLLQCLFFLAILVWWERLKSGDFLMLTVILYLTVLGGIAMGLFFSALMSSTEKAMSILPLILIPQLLLSGFFKPLEPIYLSNGRVITGREYQEQKSVQQQQPSVAAQAQPPQLAGYLSKFEGLGPGRYVAAVINARWALEALAHQVSIKDEQARQVLPTQMTVVEYMRMMEKRDFEDIETRYRQRVLLDSVVLGAFVALFLALTMWAMKRKDVL